MSVRFLSGVNVDSNTLVVDDVNNRVGIGTASPGTILEVSSATPIFRISSSLNSSFHGIEFRNGGALDAEIKQLPETGEFRISNGRNSSWGGFITLYTDTAERMRITSAGNVGIGTTSPSEKLDVNGNGRFLNSVTTFAGSSGYYGRISTEYNYPYIETFIDSIAAASWDSRLVFRTNSNAGGATTGMVIDPFGKVGIGTTSPAAKLTVAGTTYLNLTSDYFGASTTVQISSGSGSNAVGILSNTFYLYPYSSNTTTSLVYGYNGNASWGLTNAGGNSRFDFYSYSAGSSIMSITSSGNVGIGTTSPSYKLDVSGQIRVDNGVGNGSGQALIVGGSGDVTLSDGGSLFFGAYDYGGSTYIRGYDSGDVMYFYSNGTNAVYFKSDRAIFSVNVGIGTTSPSSKLHVSSSGETTLIIDSTSAGTARINLTGAGGGAGAITSTVGGLYVYASGANPITFNTNGSERLRVESNGNVGIGTTSPSTKLDVIGTGIFGTMTTSRGSYSNGLSLQNNGGQATSLFLWQDGVASAHIGSPANSTSLHIVNSYNTGLITDPNAIVLNNTGNVGIGTATPGAKIHVVGTESRFGGVASGFISVYNATGRSGYIQANGGTDLRIASDSDPMTMYVNGSERMRISSVGALKLNAYGSGSNTGTATQRLAVDASGNVIEIPIGSGPVDGNGTANYVTKWSDADTITNSIIYDNGTNVGIGTATPSSKLDVAGSTNVSTTNFYRYDGDTGIFGSGTSISGGTANQLGIRAANEILFATNGATEKMRLTTGGQLIVGGTTVGYAGTKLQVGNTSDVQNGLNILTSTTGYGYILFGDGAGADTYVGQIWYYHGDNYMGFQTNGGERMRINSAGNIGIGTTSPAYRLDVQAAAGVAVRVRNTFNTDDAYFLAQSTLGSALFGINATGQYLYTGDAIPTLFYNSGTERMRITSAGNVGIGTTSPASALQIGSVGSTGYSVGNGLAFGDGTRAGALNVDSNGTTLYSSTNLIFSPGTTEAVRITSSGYFGIGTTSPGAKLHVSGGEIRVDAGQAITLDIVNSMYLVGASNQLRLYNGGNAVINITAGGNVGILTTSPNNKLQIGSTGSSGYSGNDIAIGNGTQVMAFYQSATVSTWYTNTSFSLMPSGAGSVGNLGVGTDSPTQRVHVSGNIRVTGAYYDSNNSAGSSGQVLSSTGSGTDWVSLSEITGVDGTGTANYVAKWSDTDTITNSSITDNGSTVTATVDRLNMNKQAGIYVFSKTVGTSATSDFFSISNSHGAQAFRVTFVCSTSGYSVAKTYEVVHGYGGSPVYNKIVDTGAYSGNDFDVVFADSNGSAGTKATVTNNSTTNSGNIVATVFLGGGSETITVTAL
jgi:hypothetical protein